jgi:hypothetical protein
MNSNITTQIPPHQPYEKIKLDECHICLEYLVGEIAEVSCGHIYHLKCIQGWIKKKEHIKVVVSVIIIPK